MNFIQEYDSKESSPQATDETLLDTFRVVLSTPTLDDLQDDFLLGDLNLLLEQQFQDFAEDSPSEQVREVVREEDADNLPQNNDHIAEEMLEAANPVAFHQAALTANESAALCANFAKANRKSRANFQFRIKAILSHRVVGGGKLQFLIRWYEEQCRPHDERQTWEPYENLPITANFFTEYLIKNLKFD
jgi:hypothetical protein